jgi:hypothetical protein
VLRFIFRRALVQTRSLFTEFTQGRAFEVRLIQVQQRAQDGQGNTTVPVPATWVIVKPVTRSLLWNVCYEDN